MRTSGVIFNIQRYCIHDGTGLRTTVFLKGCPLRCLWCANPESQTMQPQVLYSHRLCKGCGACIASCPSSRLYANSDASSAIPNIVGHASIACHACGKCSDACIYGARELAGQIMTVEETLEICLKDKAFYKHSGGGVTLSGGEPFLQHDFTLELLSALRQVGISTAVETTGYTSWEYLVSAPVDLFLYDFKCLDEELHKAFTGVSNAIILDNLQRLLRLDKNVIVRMPLIPGYNTDDVLIDKTGEYLQRIGVTYAHLLPYHTLGLEKYQRLNTAYTLPEVKPPSAQLLQRIQALLLSHNIQTELS